VHDVAACNQIMDERYNLLIGGFVLTPRAVYQDATQKQLFDRFPNVMVTTHDTAISGERVAIAFTQHAASPRMNAKAAWSGVALFRSENGKLTHCFAEEDYFSRRSQLATGHASKVPSPAVDPWIIDVQSPVLKSESLVIEWLKSGESGGDVIWDDVQSAAPGAFKIVDAKSISINELFSAGSKVAFHVNVDGIYAGGIEGIPESLEGAECSMAMAGLVVVENEKVAAGRVIRDRLGLQRALTGS
jgi:hypothetical protein